MNKIIDNVALAVFMEKKGRNGLSFWMQRRLEEGSAINGCWEFPGGKIEEGETPASAAQREVWEEVGIALPKVEFFGIYQWNAPKKNLSPLCPPRKGRKSSPLLGTEMV